MADRGFVFIPVNDPLRPGQLDHAQAPRGFEGHFGGPSNPGTASQNQMPRSFDGRFGDSSHPGLVAQNQQNFTNRIPRLPTFIRTDPSLWFAQIELIFESAGIFSQRLRAGSVVTALDHEVVQTIGDLLTNNNYVENLYSEIKKRVIENFSLSPESELRSILKGEIISDGKPSLILSRIRHLRRGRCSDDVLKTIFLEHLPANCRAVLAVSETNDLNRLASMADRIMSYSSSEKNVAAVSVDPDSEILKKLEKLTLRIDALSTRSRNPSKSNNHDRSRSRSKSNSGGKNQGFYRFHRKFGKKAHRCFQPCSFEKNSKKDPKKDSKKNSKKDSKKDSDSDDSNSGN
ncbi:uncharacterized protein LOC127286129 [Leptopilina boulardi]|uniref:uncharacterized protein LOC127286129 n=1 Tax=Leptopilina boulardi TaxID=63433 RepID=UPI0021F5A75B|nr:uncharacterized protein LOC127286129 [Leptopilina boulardi]